MGKQTFDPAQFKTEQREQWGAVAAGWREWWANFEKGAQKLSDRLVELAEIRPGHRTLDIATGIGEPAVTAARGVGESGRVIAVDMSPQMLAVARERANELRLQSIARWLLVTERRHDGQATTYCPAYH